MADQMTRPSNSGSTSVPKTATLVAMPAAIQARTKPSGSRMRMRRKVASSATLPHPAIIASSAIRSRIRSLSLSLFNCPQAARISRPRGVRIGEA